jgi:hypothetical protein
MTPEEEEWLRSLNWPEIGPRLIEALEDISSALGSGKPEAAAEIVTRVWKEIGRDKLDEPTPEELAEWPYVSRIPENRLPEGWVSSRLKLKHREEP